MSNVIKEFIYEVASEYGVSPIDAEELINTLSVDSIEELNSRYICHMSEYLNYSQQHDDVICDGFVFTSTCNTSNY